MRKTDKAVELKGKVIVPSVADDLLHFIAKKERKCLDLRQGKLLSSFVISV